MAGNGNVVVPPDSTGKAIDCASLSAGGVTVYRQRVVIADGTRSANFAVCSAGSLQTTVQNTVTVSGQVSVTGSVAISNNLNISAMPSVVLAAGTALIGAVSNGAGTALMGAVSLAAGTANIGFINGISAPVVLAAGGNNIGTINAISAAVVLAAGTGTIGAVTVAGFIDPSGNQRNVVDSANTALRVNVVAGGAGGGIVFGANQDGASATAAAVLVGGRDSAGGGLVRTFLTTSTGIQFVTGQVSVTGSVAVSTLGAGTNNIGQVNVSLMPAVALAAGAANIGTINNISAAVVLATGAAHIGEVNISIMPAVVLAAGAANIGSINNISAVVSVNLAAQSAGFIVAMQGAVAFNASITAGNAPVLMGARVKTSASTTATAHAAVFLWADKAGRQITQLNAACLHPSASHGPKTVTLSSSANTVLVISAGTACIFVDSLIVTSNLAANTRCDIYETASSAAPEISQYLAASGGGFTMQLNPPWVLSAGQALSARLKPSASAQVLVTVQFHVGPN